MITLLIGFVIGAIVTGFLFLWRLPAVLKNIKKVAKWANEKAKKNDTPFAKKVREFARKLNSQAQQIGR